MSHDRFRRPPPPPRVALPRLQPSSSPLLGDVRTALTAKLRLLLKDKYSEYCHGRGTHLPPLSNQTYPRRKGRRQGAGENHDVLPTHPLHSCDQCRSDQKEERLDRWKRLFVSESLARRLITNDELQESILIWDLAPQCLCGRKLAAIEAKEKEARDELTGTSVAKVRGLRRACMPRSESPDDGTERKKAELVEVACEPLAAYDEPEPPSKLELLRGRLALEQSESFDRNGFESTERKQWILLCHSHISAMHEMEVAARKQAHEDLAQKAAELLEACSASVEETVAPEERDVRQELRGQMLKEKRTLRVKYLRAMTAELEAQESLVRRRVQGTLIKEMHITQRLTLEESEVLLRQSMLDELRLTPICPESSQPTARRPEEPVSPGSPFSKASGTATSRHVGSYRFQFVEYLEHQKRAALVDDYTEICALLSEFSAAPSAMDVCPLLLQYCHVGGTPAAPTPFSPVLIERPLSSLRSAEAPSPLCALPADIGVVLTDLSALRDALSSRQSESGTLSRQRRRMPQDAFERRLTVVSPQAEVEAVKISRLPDPRLRARRKTLF